MVNPFEIVDLTHEVRKLAISKISDINDINRETTFLALNALIEAARAGDAGKGFAVVANQVKHVSSRISEITTVLNKELAGSLSRLTDLGDTMIEKMQSQEGHRFADLALNMVDIIDRNLYERSCDVRWWATDSAVVECTATGAREAQQHAAHRLSVILNSYTVYLDLWVVDTSGRVLANGRPNTYPMNGKDVSSLPCFRSALATSSGADFVASDIEVSTCLKNAHVATYATAIRERGAPDGRPLGVLMAFFDWSKQSAAVVKGVRLSKEEWKNTRCVIVDSSFRVIASSDEKGILEEHCKLNTSGKSTGFYRTNDGETISFAATPGYENYKGLGWYGVVIRRASHDR